jgi:hypothetical protein
MTDLASLARRAAEQKAIADHACAQAGSHGEEDHVARANAGTVLMLCHLPSVRIVCQPAGDCEFPLEY